jgi:hypothetical protein
MHVHVRLLPHRKAYILEDVYDIGHSGADRTTMEPDRGPGRATSRFDQSDYCFGAGPLWLRIEHVDWANPVSYDNDIWYTVDGVEMSSTGQEVGRRQTLIRATRLAATPGIRRA